MPPVKSLDRISDKWARVSQVSQPEYIDGVTNPAKDWAAETKKAEANYERGVQQAMQNKRFGKGVSSAGTEKWKSQTLAKGPDRWAQGIAISRNAYESGFSPYREIIERLDLPARGPKGDPKNIQRVAMIADALHKGKLARKGG